MDSLGLMRITSDFLETFSKIQNPVLTDRYLRRLAGSLGVDENSLRSELLKLKKKDERKPKTAAPEEKKTAKEGFELDEVLLLALSVEEASLRRKLLLSCEESDFTTFSGKELFQRLASMEAAKEIINWPKILNRLQESAFKEKLTAQLSLEWDLDQKAKAFEDCLAHIKAKKVEKKLEDLRRSIAKAEREGNTALIGEYAKEYQALWKENKLSSPSGH